MLLAVRLASQRRQQYLKNLERSSAEEHVRRLSEKRKQQEIKDLQEKKMKLSSVCEAATRPIDNQLHLLKK
jgi:hypothetical protein